MRVAAASDPKLLSEIRKVRGGHVPEIYAALAHTPAIAKAWMELGTKINTASLLDPRLRELSILAVAASLNCEYERHHHRPKARSLGFSDESLDALENGSQTGDLFNEVELAVIAATEQLTKSGELEPERYAGIRAALGSDTAVVEFVVTVGFYNAVTRLVGALEIAPESFIVDVG